MPSVRARRSVLALVVALTLLLGALPAAAQQAEDPGPTEIELVKAWFDAEGVQLDAAPPVDWTLSLYVGTPDGEDIAAQLPDGPVSVSLPWSEGEDGSWYPTRYGLQEDPAAFGWQAVACDSLTIDMEALGLDDAPVESDTSALKVAQGAPDGSIAATTTGVHLVCNQRQLAGDLDPIWPDVTPDGTHTFDIIDLAIDGILLGRADGDFQPASSVTRGQVASVLARAAGVDAAPLDDPSFDDIADTTHEAAIEALVELEVLTGYEDGTFQPNQPVSRAQVASMISRWLEVEPIEEGPFTDVTPGSTHAGAINALADLEIVRGRTDTTFEPDLDVRRDQFAAFVNRAR